VGLIDNDTVGYGWSSLRITFAPSFSILCAFYIAPELLSPRLRFVGSVKRFAIQRRGRRRVGMSILRDFTATTPSAAMAYGGARNWLPLSF
jgi:hypothetical protein